MLEFVMLALRTSDGLNLKEFTRFHGEELKKKIIKTLERFEASGQVQFDNEDDSVRLCDPEGFVVSNDIISSVFAAIMD
jgi:oxygen-independent coproporphyrinogen-3 oxidase